MSKLSRDEQDMKDEIAYRESVQEELDAEQVREAQRAASGFSPEQVAIMDAANDGRRAGAYGFSPSLNHYPSTDPRHSAWERARMQAAAIRANGNAMRRMP